MTEDFNVYDMTIGHLTRDSKKSKLGLWGTHAHKHKEDDRAFKEIERIAEKDLRKAAFADLIGKERGSISNSIKNLKDLGIVEEEESGRFVRIRMSKEFRKVLKKAVR